MKWAEQLESWEHMETTPGPYLRRTMLEILEKETSDMVCWAIEMESSKVS